MAVGVGGTGRAASRGLRRLTSPAGLRGVGTELAWVAAHAALYPLGFRPERRDGGGPPRRIDDLSPQHRGLLAHDAAAAATPVLLVHGMVDNRSIFTLMCRSLRRCGFGQVRTVNYSVFTSDVRAAAAGLGRTVEQVCADTGYERVHLVAHSLGGVVARYYVQRLAGDARVHTLVTLGAPHGGTLAAQVVARVLPLRLCRQLRPGSDLIAELAEPAPGCRTRFLAVWSDLDQLIYPKTSARIEHPDLVADNVLVPGLGHMSLPAAAPVARTVSRALAHLDPDGTHWDIDGSRSDIDCA
jgi:triacylglycerol esterase/lipase EstA (alpha/beta hydrolase family)